MVRLTALLLMTATLSAADLRVLSVGAIEPGLGRIAEAYRRETGHNVTIQVDTAPGLSKRLASGETADVFIAPPNVIDEAIKSAKAAPASRTMIARVGIGAAVRKGAKPPNLQTLDALRQALLAADAVVYNEGSSGLYLEKLFGQIGVSDRLKAKTVRYPNGGQVVQHILDAKGGEIGFLPIPVIRSNEPKGLQFAGPLPSDAQNYTTYEAVAMTGGGAMDAARDFIRYLTTPAAKQVFAAAGVE